jgi:hypothetical protein
MYGATEPQIFIFETVQPPQLQVMIQVFWNVNTFAASYLNLYRYLINNKSDNGNVNWMY